VENVYKYIIIYGYGAISSGEQLTHAHTSLRRRRRSFRGQNKERIVGREQTGCPLFGAIPVKGQALCVCVCVCVCRTAVITRDGILQSEKFAV